MRAQVPPGSVRYVLWGSTASRAYDRQPPSVHGKLACATPPGKQQTHGAAVAQTPVTDGEVAQTPVADGAVTHAWQSRPRLIQR